MNPILQLVEVARQHAQFLRMVAKHIPGEDSAGLIEEPAVEWEKLADAAEQFWATHEHHQSI